MDKITKHEPPPPARGAGELAQMRHDIRGSLNAVMGLSHMLAASDSLNPRQREMADTLKSSAEDLRKLIEDIFNFNPPREETAAPGPGGPGHESGASRRVLLVEDYAPTILMMEKFLEELGYEYDIARTGREALEKFFDHPYGFVLMDLQLPDIDGLEITRRIRAMEKEKGLAPVPIIATSGQEEDRKICLRLGMSDCLSKPFGLEELESKLSTGYPP